MTKQFSVTLDDRPGELAKLTGTLAEKGINIRSAAGASLGGKGVIYLVTSDEAKTRDTLRTQRFTFTEDEALLAQLEDKPGTLSQVAKNLATANVNIKSFLLLSNKGPHVEVALTVDDPEKAKTIIP